MENMKQLVEKLIESKVLLHLDDSPLKKDKGLVVVACGDGDRFPELYDYEKKLCSLGSGTGRLHELTLNGGALQLSPDSPLNRDGSSKVLLKQLIESIELKQITDVALYGHYECGAAKAYGFTEADHFKWLAEAAKYCREEIKKSLPNLDVKVACKFHYEIIPGKKFKSYYFDDQAWFDIQSEEASSVTA